MPADQLTRTEPLATAVLDALRNDTARAAERHGLDPGTLASAVDAFSTAGLAALAGVPGSRWTQAHVIFPGNADPAETTVAVAGVLDRLGEAGHHCGWWFLNKPPGWRLRLLDADRAALTGELDRLCAERVIAGWVATVYEPETTAFGGATAMTTVHDLFCADTRGALAHLATDSTLGPREASFVLLGALTRGARLDAFETADVFAKVAALRPPVRDDKAGAVRRLAARLRPLLLTRPDTTTLAGTAGAHIGPWADAFGTAGSRLADLAATGRLHRGLRSVLAQVVIFHWNRLALTGTAQAALAGAAVHALLPGDNPGVQP